MGRKLIKYEKVESKKTKKGKGEREGTREGRKKERVVTEEGKRRESLMERKDREGEGKRVKEWEKISRRKGERSK